MEKYLQQCLYVYRKSYIYFYKIVIGLSISNLLFSASGLSSLALPPLDCLSLGAVVIEILDKRLKISERIEEYKLIYKFYRQLLHLYKADKINEKEVNLREEEFVSNFNYFFVRHCQNLRIFSCVNGF
jgi:hypothetical protein